MLWRTVRGRPLREATLDALNRISLMMVIAVSLATILVTSSHLTRHFGLVRGNPLVVFAPPNDPTRGLDLATRKEVGVGPSLTAAPATPDNAPAPVLGVADESTISPAVPSASDLLRPLKGGTWLPIVMYHYVRDVSPSDRVGWNLSVSPDNFKKQVRWLSDHGYTTLTMRQADLILAGQARAPERPVVLTFDDGYRDFYTTAVPLLRSAGFSATSYIPTRLVGTEGYLTWSEIQELDAEGFEMAAHTQYHTDITKVPATQARVEVLASKADLESHLGHPVVDWAYPYGGYDLKAIQLVKDAGFWSATTTDGGSWHDARHMLYLSRVRMGGPAELSSLISGVTPPPIPSPPATR